MVIERLNSRKFFLSKFHFKVFHIRLKNLEVINSRAKR